MAYYSFEKVFEEFAKLKNPQEGCEHDIGKVRDKYTEIIDATGIDKCLLHARKKTTADDGKTIKSGAYIIPEESVDFCVQIILKYTTTDFRSLRSAEFRDMSVRTVQFLIDGFCQYLFNMGYSHTVILQQYRAMDQRMHYKIRLSEHVLSDELNGIRKLAEEYETSVYDFNYGDSVYFIRYMSQKVADIHKFIDSVYSAYTDIRSHELEDIDMEEANKETPQESFDRINRELLLSESLENNKEFQELLAKREKILAERNFIKKKQGRYSKIVEQMQKIRESYEHKLFDEILSEKSEPIMKVRHPLDVLQESVAYVEDNEADDIKRDIEEANKTSDEIEKEQRSMDAVREILESKGFNFDLPNTDNYEKEIFMTSNVAYQMKGMISFHCCEKEKIIVYAGATGQCSNKCPCCGKYAIFDFDKMTSTTVEVAKGATYKFRK